MVWSFSSVLFSRLFYFFFCIVVLCVLHWFCFGTPLKTRWYISRDVSRYNKFDLCDGLGPQCLFWPASAFFFQILPGCLVPPTSLRDWWHLLGAFASGVSPRWLPLSPSWKAGAFQALNLVLFGLVVFGLSLVDYWYFRLFLVSQHLTPTLHHWLLTKHISFLI